MRKKEFDNKSIQSGESGFSMIEMLIAIVVVTFGLVAIVGISAYVSRANSVSGTLNVSLPVPRLEIWSSDRAHRHHRHVERPGLGRSVPG